MPRPTIILSVLVVLVGGLVGMAFLGPGKEWRNISTAFVGITNSPPSQMAVIALENRGDRTVQLRRYWIEYIGVPPPPGTTGLTNKMRGYTIRPLLVGPAQKAALLVPLPQEGSRWVAHLSFEPTGWKLKLADYLAGKKWAWKRSLPRRIRSIPTHFLRQPFTAESPESRPRETNAQPKSITS